MSPPAVPSFVDAVSAVTRLQLRRLWRGKKPVLAAVALFVVSGGIIATRYAAASARTSEIVRGGISLGYFGLLVYLLPFLFGSGAIAEEVEGRTFPFLVSRPISRSSVVLGKFLAAAALTTAMLFGGTIVVHVACFIAQPTELIHGFGEAARLGGALSLLGLCYCAICLFWGALAVEASGIVSALYLGVIEFVFSLVPGPFRLVSMQYLASELAGLTKGGVYPDSVPDVKAWIAALVIVGVGAMFLGFGALTASLSEYRFGRA